MPGGGVHPADGASEEAALVAKVFGLAVHVVDELVDERDGDLFDLRCGGRRLADEDVASGVDLAPGFGVEHGFRLLGRSGQGNGFRAIAGSGRAVCWPAPDTR